MKLFSKTFIAGAIAFFVGFGALFGIQGILKASNPNVIEEEETSSNKEVSHQKMLLNSLMNMGTFQVDGGMDFTLEDNTVIKVGMDVVGDITDLNNVKVQGDVNLYLNGINLTTNIGYFKDESVNEDKGAIYFSYKENNFYLETEHLLDFIDMLPTEYGIALNLPSELQNLDLKTISSMIENMEEKESTNGDIYFILSLSEDLDLYIKTDSEYTFKGIRTDTIKYKGNEIKLDLDLTKTNDVELVRPNKNNYQNFKPIFNVFKSLYNFTHTKQNSINITANLSKKHIDEDEIVTYEPFLDASLDLGYDVDARSFQIDADLKENNRHHQVGMLFEDSTAYLDIRATKVSIKFDSVGDVIAYIANQLDFDVTEKLMDSLSEVLSSDKFADLREGLNNLIGKISLTETSLSIELDLDALGLDMGKITPTINFENGKLVSIIVNGLKVSKYKADIAITFQNYTHRNIVKDEYIPFEPALTIVEAIMPLIKQTQFRIEFAALVESNKDDVKDITIDGGLQFDISDHGFGYGKAVIVDRDNYRHEIKADMKTKDEFLFSYNDTLNGKFSSKTLKDIYGLISDIINNPDEHFIELFGELLESMKNAPIGKVLDGDYLAILETQLINSLEIDETHIKMNISLAIIGMDDKSCDVEIFYHRDNNIDKAYLDGVKLSNLKLGDEVITFTANLKDFDPSKESERLDAYEEYLDFSDIKVLLQLGVNTSKFEYFHFSSKLDLSFHLITDINLSDMTLDIKIRNNKGKVQVAVEFYDIPIIDLKLISLNSNSDYTGTDGRSASLYFDEDIFYVKRVDDVHTFLHWNEYTVTYGATYSTDYFLENIAKIFLSDILGVQDRWMEKFLKDDSSSSESSQIEYEKILKDFRYDESAGTFTFKIDLYSLTHVDMLQTADLVVFEDKSTEQLSGVNLSLTIHFITNINAKLSLTTVSKDTTLSDANKLETLNNWAAYREGATINSFEQISRVDR